MILAVTYTDVAFFSFLVLLSFLVLVATFFFGYWISRRRTCPSPYSSLPLRRGSDLPYSSMEKILRYLYTLHQYDNRMFDLNQAAYCRETGRVFPKAVGLFGTIHVDWNFLQKRYPGQYVSWGSLTEQQQEAIRDAHYSLEGFQTDFSSGQASPRMIEPEFAFAKPGPLYVDLTTYVVLGWKCVPNTEFEVLIAQKPRKIFELK